MRKHLLSLLALASFSFANAQTILTESFESSSFPPGGWSVFNNGTGNSWALNDFNATYASQGVQSMFYEYSPSDPADTWAFSPGLNLSIGDSIVISFDYIVADFDYPEKMKVTIGNGQSVGVQTTVLWNDTSIVNTTFQTASVGYKITSNGNFNLGFNCYSNTDMYYLVVDNIHVRKVLSSDLKMNVYTGPTRSCSFSAGEELSITVSNIGGAAQTNFPLAYTINNGPVVSETYVGNIAAGASSVYTYLAGADFSAPGTYQVKMFTQLASEGDRSNDTISFTVVSEPSGIMVNSSLDTIHIPDNGIGVISEIPFCGIANNLGTNIRIKRLTVESIIHTYADDIDLTLISPLGDSLILSADVGNDNPDYPTVTFTDTALTNIVIFDQDPILTGYYHPQDSLGFAKFNGQDPNGVWKLKIVDDAGADFGYLSEWTLEFDNSVGIKEYPNKSNLITLYPNPNKGIFTIESLASELNIEIYSITGQSIEQLSLNAKDKKILDLRSLAKGMYFVKAISENAIQTSKVIIE